MTKTETQVAVHVTNEFKERIKAQARKERRSAAGMVCIVMEDYLDAKEKEELDNPSPRHYNKP